ncbi:hypothetical protein EDC04DRAFT_3094738 [Pisolithus marmoratus]|nr:hypothetical protein EDC04DRAFT_3094738 [Pisolithus marmoratus]
MISRFTPTVWVINETKSPHPVASHIHALSYHKLESQGLPASSHGGEWGVILGVSSTVYSQQLSLEAYPALQARAVAVDLLLPTPSGQGVPYRIVGVYTPWDPGILPDFWPQLATSWLLEFESPLCDTLICIRVPFSEEHDMYLMKYLTKYCPYRENEGTYEDLTHLRHLTAKSAQNIFNSHHEPEIPTREEEGSVDSPNDCTETKTGYLTPEIDVIDVQQVEDYLPVVEVGKEDPERPSECVNVLDAADEASQHADDEVAERRNLTEWSTEAPELVDGPNRQSCGHSIEFALKTCLRQDQSLLTSGETILDVPGPPPDTRTKCPTLQDERSSKVQSCDKPETGSERENDECAKLERHGTPVISQILPPEASRWGDSSNSDATSSRTVCSHGAEKQLLADSKSSLIHDPIALEIA